MTRRPRGPRCEDCRPCHSGTPPRSRRSSVETSAAATSASSWQRHQQSSGSRRLLMTGKDVDRAVHRGSNLQLFRSLSQTVNARLKYTITTEYDCISTGKRYKPTKLIELNLKKTGDILPGLPCFIFTDNFSRPGRALRPVCLENHF